MQLSHGLATARGCLRLAYQSGKPPHAGCCKSTNEHRVEARCVLPTAHLPPTTCSPPRPPLSCSAMGCRWHCSPARPRCPGGARGAWARLCPPPVRAASRRPKPIPPTLQANGAESRVGRGSQAPEPIPTSTRRALPPDPGTCLQRVGRCLPARNPGSPLCP